MLKKRKKPKGIRRPNLPIGVRPLLPSGTFEMLNFSANLHAGDCQIKKE